MKNYLYSVVLSIALVACSADVYELSGSPRAQARSIKRGVSYGFSLPAVDAALLGPSISWFYNWGPNISAEMGNLASLYQLDFFPMAWNGAFDAEQIRAYKAFNPNCQYILAFNEPNFTDQANLTPAQAAAEWPKVKALAEELNLKIVSPAMNYGTIEGYSDPIVWLDEFFTLVPLDDMDAIAIHCYMGNASALKSYVERFKKYDKPIWMTEFCAWESFISNATAQMKFMSEAIQYMEQEPMIARYAWFMPRTSGAVDSYPYMQLLTKSQPYDLTPLGQVFTQISSCDQSVYAVADQIIEAEHFTQSNIVDVIGQEGFSALVHLRPTSDTAGGNLEIYDFYSNKWLSYQIELTKTATYFFTMRYASAYDSSIQLMVDGQNTLLMDIPSTGSETEWVTITYPFDITEGKHILRLLPQGASICVNWLKIES